MNINTRGFRNNNPLNIRHGMSHWQHMAKVQTDPSFVVFENMVWGYRAAWKLMESYKLRLEEARKPFSIHNIVSRWAPETENNTRSYIQQVARLSGISEFRQLTKPSIKGNDIEKVIQAMTCVENGITMDQVPTVDIRTAYTKAFPHGWLE